MVDMLTTTSAAPAPKAPTVTKAREAVLRLAALFLPGVYYRARDINIHELAESVRRLRATYNFDVETLYQIDCWLEVYGGGE